MANFFKDNDDLQFYMRRAIDWDTLVRVTERDFAFVDDGGFSSTAEALEFYDDIATMFGEFVAEQIAPYTAEIDRTGVVLEDGEVQLEARQDAIFAHIKELDLHGLPVPRELGGMNAPLMLYFINAEVMARADVSVMAHHSFHAGIAMAALVFSAIEGTTEVDERGHIVKTRFEDAVREIARGDAWGCMDITEPDAGSDMAQLRSVGEQDDDGHWFVTGEKIFITAGHGKYHFVIARTEPEGGLDALSMFLVPAYEDLPGGGRKRIVEVTRVEEKLGHHGSATCALQFERAPAFLVGQRGEGFKYMLTLMNNARLGVGFECIGLCVAALELAKAYAAQRKSMGKTIDRHEMIADYLDRMDVETRGIRAIAMTAAYHEELFQKLNLEVRFDRVQGAERERLEKQLEHHKAQARRLTPLLKYQAAEKAVEHARLCLQIHGGNGYTKEYGAEKLLRDALVMPIYEGTSQIQSLMAMKDTLGSIIANPAGFVRRLADTRWRSISARDPLERRVAHLQALSLGAQQHLVLRTAGDKVKALRDVPLREWQERFTKNWDPKRDFAFAMLHAEKLIKLLIIEAIAEILLDQAQRFPERRTLLEKHLERSEIDARTLHEQITTTGQRLLERLAGAGDGLTDEERAAE